MVDTSGTGFSSYDYKQYEEEMNVRYSYLDILEEKRLELILLRILWSIARLMHDFKSKIVQSISYQIIHIKRSIENNGCHNFKKGI